MTSAAAEALAAQYRLYAAHVVDVRRIGGCLIRITFGGTDLAGFASGGRDQSVSLFLPHPDSRRRCCRSRASRTGPPPTGRWTRTCGR